MFKLLQKRISNRNVVDRAVVIKKAKEKINGVPGGAIVEGSYGVWSR
ncbi:hypothetical protein [Stutzerimonas nitrititolerans]|nr:hypothetical protein [Stutzerimonas nitrititolerans]SUD84718.1 Uncharacterised protein [Stutzerimonas stutzeri]